MKLTEVLNDGLKRGYVLTLTSAEIDARQAERLLQTRHQGHNANTPGAAAAATPQCNPFDNRLRGDAMQDLISSTLQSHFDGSGDRPAMEPDMRFPNSQGWKPGDDVLVELDYEVLPEIEEPDLSAITLQRLVVGVDEASVAEALDKLVAGPDQAVRAPATAEWTDALARRLGADDLDDLKAQVAQRLQAEFEAASRAVLKRSLLDQLDARATFHLPQTLVKAEAYQVAQRLSTEVPAHLHDSSPGTVEPTEAHRKLAERRIRLALLLAELGRKAEVQVSDEEFRQAVLSQARQYPEQQQQFIDHVERDPRAQQQLRASLLEDKVVDHLLAGLAVSDRDVGKDELRQAVEALNRF